VAVVGGVMFFGAAALAVLSSPAAVVTG